MGALQEVVAFTNMEQDEQQDPVALARKFVTGLNIKRGESIAMVKGLLALLDGREQWIAAAVAVSADTVPLGPVHDPRKLPECFVTVERTSTGAVLVGHDANRTYSRDEALSLVEKILKAAQ